MRSFLIIFCLLLSVALGYGQTAKYSNDYLNIGVSAKAHGLGKAVSSTLFGVEAATWNPANLSTNGGPLQVGGMHAAWFGNSVSYDYLGVAKEFGKDSGKYGAISMVRMATDNIPNTLALVDETGRINFDNISSFSEASYGMFATFSSNIGTTKWRYGINAKLIRRILGRFGNAWGTGLDLGFSYHSKKADFGIMAKDISTTYNAWRFNFNEQDRIVLQKTGNEVPESSTEITLPTLVLGGAYNIAWSDNFSSKIMLDLDVFFDGKRNTLVATDAFSIDPHVGIEFNSKDAIFVRAGLSGVQKVKKVLDPSKYEYLLQPTFGIGLRLGRINIDYALALLNGFGDENNNLSNVFSATYTIASRNKDQ